MGPVGFGRNVANKSTEILIKDKRECDFPYDRKKLLMFLASFLWHTNLVIGHTDLLMTFL